MVVWLDTAGGAKFVEEALHVCLAAPDSEEASAGSLLVLLLLGRRLGRKVVDAACFSSVVGRVKVGARHPVWLLGVLSVVVLLSAGPHLLLPLLELGTALREDDLLLGLP